MSIVDYRLFGYQLWTMDYRLSTLIQEPTDLQINDFITRAFREDVGEGDHTSLACIPADARTKARLLVKSDCVLAGVALAKRIFKSVDKTVEFNLMMPDGTRAKYGDVAFTVECNSRALLQAERLSLNAMQRMSGIATLSREFVDKIEGWIKSKVHLPNCSIRARRLPYSASSKNGQYASAARPIIVSVCTIGLW